MNATTIAKPYFGLAAVLLMVATTASQAIVLQPAPDSHDVMVVTLYSESRPARGTLRTDGQSERPPIQIVDGGVKSAAPSCWTLDESGQIGPVAGECCILRSAATGEKSLVRVGQ